MSSPLPDNFPKRLLKSKKFTGYYKEKRFCKELQRYKDIVVVKASQEPNIALDFNLVLDLLSTSTKWLGLTTTHEKEYCLWVDLDADGEDMPFDDYDFEIRTVKTTETEVQLKLRVLGKRDLNKSSCSTLSADGPSFDLSSVNWSDYEPKKILNACLGFLLSIQWNWAAIKQSIEFVMVTLVYLVSEIPNLIRFVGEFTLRAFRELSNLIHVCTPLFMGLLDMVSKIIGVLFMLISDVIRSGRGRAVPAEHRQRQLTYR